MDRNCQPVNEGYGNDERQELPMVEHQSVTVCMVDSEGGFAEVHAHRQPPDQDRIVTALVSVKKVASRSEAIQWLVEQGISAKADYIERVLARADQIEEILREMQEPDT